MHVLTDICPRSQTSSQRSSFYCVLCFSSSCTLCTVYFSVVSTWGERGRALFRVGTTSFKELLKWTLFCGFEIPPCLSVSLSTTARSFFFNIGQLPVHLKLIRNFKVSWQSQSDTHFSYLAQFSIDLPVTVATEPTHFCFWWLFESCPVARLYPFWML